MKSGLKTAMINMAHEAVKRGSLPTLAMSLEGSAKHLGRMGTFARNVGMASRAHVAETNASLLAFRPKPLAQGALQHAAAPVAQAAQVARKATPTTGHNPLELARHLGRTNPAQAVQASRQYKLPLSANANTLDQLSRSSFSKLSKALEYAQFESASALQQALKPGDILVSSPRPADKQTGLTRRAVNALKATVIKGVQNSKYTHASMYAGKGKVLNLRPEGFSETHLSAVIQGTNTVALRPNADLSSREKAIARIREAKDHIRYHLPSLLRPALGRLVSSRDAVNTRIEDSVCSTMIAKAYRPNLVPNKAKDAVAPVDFLHSPRVTILGEYRGASA